MCSSREWPWSVRRGRIEPRRSGGIARTDGEPLALGGVCESWRTPSGEFERTFAIITTRPNAEMLPLHDRMPLVIDPANWPARLGEFEADPSTLLGSPPDEI